MTDDAVRITQLEAELAAYKLLATHADQTASLTVEELAGFLVFEGLNLALRPFLYDSHPLSQSRAHSRCPVTVPHLGHAQGARFERQGRPLLRGHAVAPARRRAWRSAGAAGGRAGGRTPTGRRESPGRQPAWSPPSARRRRGRARRGPEPEAGARLCRRAPGARRGCTSNHGRRSWSSPHVDLPQYRTYVLIRGDRG